MTAGLGLTIDVIIAFLNPEVDGPGIYMKG